MPRSHQSLKSTQLKARISVSAGTQADSTKSVNSKASSLEMKNSNIKKSITRKRPREKV